MAVFKLGRIIFKEIRIPVLNLKFVLFKSIIIFCCLSYSVVSFANCKGVIINSSNVPWKVKFLEDGQYGNVYFSGGVSCPPNGPCVIPPKSYAKIEYTQTRGEIYGHVVLTDFYGVYSPHVYHNNWFYTCPTIDSVATRANIQYNTPSSGSIEINAEHF